MSIFIFFKIYICVLQMEILVHRLEPSGNYHFHSSSFLFLFYLTFSVRMSMTTVSISLCNRYESINKRWAWRWVRIRYLTSKGDIITYTGLLAFHSALSQDAVETRHRPLLWDRIYFLTWKKHSSLHGTEHYVPFHNSFSFCWTDTKVFITIRDCIIKSMEANEKVI